MNFFVIENIAVSEVKSLLMQKTFAILLILFISMALFSTYIGWSTKQTVLEIYDETVKEMTASGLREIPPNPFLAYSPLYILKNMVVYVFLIGSLLAIIVGHSAFIRERRAGVAKIIFSRPLSRSEFILGKMAGIFLALALVMVASCLVSLVSASLVYGRLLTFSEILKLLLFYGISLGYILVFSLFGLFFSIRSKSESLALLAPIIIWILISFVMPQLTSALDPTALLNPTNIQTVVLQNDFFAAIQRSIEPFSVSQDYKVIGRSLLQGDMDSYPVWSLLSYLSVMIGACFFVMRRYDVSETEIGE